ncbi:MAG: hypothetical protein FJ197_04355 [Gammaproteobacteria bacterium]|nr:hypothetical protein [Gammaproteobacteria bacterium]
MIGLPMLVAIAIHTHSDGRLHACAPDFSGCAVSGALEEIVLPTLRLQVEDEITARLLNKAALPETRNGDPPRGAGQPGVRWANIHINLGHLVALAKTQQRA